MGFQLPTSTGEWTPEFWTINSPSPPAPSTINASDSEFQAFDLGYEPGVPHFVGAKWGQIGSGVPRHESGVWLGTIDRNRWWTFHLFAGRIQPTYIGVGKWLPS